MSVELDRIVDQMEFRVEDNRIVGSYHGRNLKAVRAVKARMAGYPASQRVTVLGQMKMILAVDLLQDLLKAEFNGTFPSSSNLLLSEGSDDERITESGKRRGRPPKQNLEPKAEKA